METLNEPMEFQSYGLVICPRCMELCHSDELIYAEGMELCKFCIFEI